RRGPGCCPDRGQQGSRVLREARDRAVRLVDRPDPVLPQERLQGSAEAALRSLLSALARLSRVPFLTRDPDQLLEVTDLANGGAPRVRKRGGREKVARRLDA